MSLDFRRVPNSVISPSRRLSSTSAWANQHLRDDVERWKSWGTLSWVDLPLRDSLTMSSLYSFPNFLGVGTSAQPAESAPWGCQAELRQSRPTCGEDDKQDV